MEYVTLGKSDLTVSRICMGCMGFGNAATGQHSWTVDEETSKSIIKRGLDLGINFYDTAIAYQAGTSEEYLGKAVKEYAKRDEVVIATKFLPRSQDEIAQGISGKAHVLSSLDASLSHLGMDYVDLYIYHMWDWNTPVEEYLAGMAEGVKAGKIRQIGIANCFAWQLAEANAIAKENGWPEFVSVQNHHNLIMREDEREMKVYADERNIALTPYSALAAGRLSKRPGETSKRLEQDIISNDVSFEVADTGEVQMVAMKDDTAKGKVLINKIDADNEEPLKGVEFEFRDSNGKVLEKLVTDAAGHAESGLYEIATYKNGEFGEPIKYYLVETKTLDGYELDSTQHEIVFEYVDQNTPIIEVTKNLTNKEKPQEPGTPGTPTTGNPKTGDETNLWLPILLMLGAGSLAAGILFGSRKKKKVNKKAD